MELCYYILHIYYRISNLLAMHFASSVPDAACRIAVVVIFLACVVFFILYRLTLENMFNLLLAAIAMMC